MADVIRTEKMIPFITCEISLGQCVCELVFGVKMYLIWILESELIRSNNQSRASLWVLETCLIVRVSSLYNHLDHCFVVFKDIQQSFLMRRIDVWGNKISIVQIIDHFLRLLSFFNCVMWRTNLTFVLNKSHRSLLHWCVFPWRTATIRSHKSSAEIPCTSILHPKKWFLILLNCTKLKFVSYSSNWLERTYDCQKTHNVPPDVDFESSRSPAKSESWNSPILHCFGVLPTWQYCLYSHVWWMEEIKRDNRLSQASVHFVIDRVNLFTDQRISGLRMRARFQHFRTIWEHTCDNSPTDFNSSSLNW